MPNVNWDAYGYGGGGAPGFDESWLPHGQQPNVFDMAPDRSGTWNTQPSGTSPLAPSAAPPQFAASPSGSHTDLVSNYWASDRRDAILRELQANYWAPDRNQEIGRWQNMSDSQLWPNGTGHLPNETAPGGYNSSTPNPSAGGGGNPAAFQKAWFESGGKNVTDLAAFVKAHPNLALRSPAARAARSHSGTAKRFRRCARPASMGASAPAWDDLSAAAGGAGGDRQCVRCLRERDSIAALGLASAGQFADEHAPPVRRAESGEGLNAAPYTDPESAALVAQYRNPATQARDAALQQQQESLARYGYLPSSGLAQKQRADIQNTYQQGIAQASNDLAVRAVGQKQQNAQEQLAILASLMGNETSMRNEDLQRTLESVQTAQLLPQLQQSQLQSLITASNPGTDQTAALSALMQMLGLNQHQNQIDQGNQQANAAAWGQYLAYVLQNLPH
jgi:hypothetical protein